MNKQRTWRAAWTFPLLVLLLAWLTDMPPQFVFVLLVAAALTLLTLGVGSVVLDSIVEFLSEFRDLSPQASLSSLINVLLLMLTTLVLFTCALGLTVAAGELVLAVQWVGEILKQGGRSVDFEILFVATVATLTAGICRLIAPLLPSHSASAVDEPDVNPERLALELALALALIAVALYPAALNASWVPNFAAGILIPVGVLVLREKRRSSRDTAQQRTKRRPMLERILISVGVTGLFILGLLTYLGVFDPPWNTK